MARSGSSQRLAAALLAGLAVTAACLHTGPARERALVLRTPDGRAVAPLEIVDGPAVCLVFVAPDCPISNVYARELERIRTAYAPRRIATYLVYSDPAFTAGDVLRHVADYDLSAEALLDPQGELAGLVGATITPEAAVWSDAGGVVYRGRIDDLYVDFGKKRARATTHDLRRALDAVLAGQPVPVARTRAIGCYLPGRGPRGEADDGP